MTMQAVHQISLHSKTIIQVHFMALKYNNSRAFALLLYKSLDNFLNLWISTYNFKNFAYWKSANIGNEFREC